MSPQSPLFSLSPQGSAWMDFLWGNHLTLSHPSCHQPTSNPSLLLHPTSTRRRKCAGFYIMGSHKLCPDLFPGKNYEELTHMDTSSDS